SAATRTDIIQRKRPRGAKQLAEFAADSDSPQRTAESSRCSCEPDFVTGRRPSQTESASPPLGEIRFLAVEIDDADDAAIITKQRMCGDTQSIALGRETDMGDPTVSCI